MPSRLITDYCEQNKAYIPAKRHLTKWVGTCVGFLLLAAIILGVMILI